MGKAAKTFEELAMYQRARELVNAIYAATRDGTFAKDYPMRSHQYIEGGVTEIDLHEE